MTDKPQGDREVPVERSEEKAEPSTVPTDATKASADAPPPLPDPNDEIPVPVVMSAAEIDERAKVVETLREEEGVPTPPGQSGGISTPPEQSDEKR